MAKGGKNGVELAKAYVQIIPSMEGIQSGIENALNGGGGMGDIGSRAGNALGGAFSSAFSKAVGFLKDSVATGMGFDSAVSQIAATMGKSVDQITELRDKAKEMGAATNYSATQAAEGLNILAMSGYDAEKSMEMLEDVLHLAAAGGMEMSEAAGDISGAMKGFGDASKDSAYYADLMAKGATLANTSVSQLGQALADGSSMGKAYSQSAEGMTVSLLRLAEQGETGAAAATALSAAYANLYTPMDQAKEAMDELGVSAYDSTGATRDFNTVVNELNEAIQRESQGNEAIANQYKDLIFGKQGLNAYNKLVVTSIDTQEQWAQTLKDSTGAAAAQYDTMTDNLKGDLDMMQSAFEGLQIQISDELSGDIRKLVQTASEGLTWLTEHSKDLIGTIKAIGVAAVAMNLPAILGAARAAMLAFNAACAANPLGLALSAVAASTIFVSTQIDKMTDKINEIPDAFEGLDEGQTEFVKKLAEGTDDLAESEKRCAEAEEMFHAAQEKRNSLQSELASAQEELHAINEKWVITQDEKLRRQELEREIIPGLTAEIKSQNAAVGELGAAYLSVKDSTQALAEAQEQEQQEIVETTEAVQAQEEADENLAAKKEVLAEKLKKAMKEALDVNIELDGKTVELSRTTAESIGLIIDEYDKMYESQRKAIEGSFSLFNGFTADTSMTFDTLMKNLQDTSFYMNDWATAIEQLGQKGVSKDLLEELQGMGADSWKLVYSLNHATQEQLAEYSALWESTHAQIKTTTDRMMADEKTAAEQLIGSFKEVPETDLEEIRAAFERAGLASVNGYEKAVEDYLGQKEKAIDKIVDAQIAALESDDTIKKLEDAGKSLPYGLAVGMNDPDAMVRLDEATSVIVKRVIDETKKKFDSHSPSRVFADIGEDLPAGLGVGMENNTDSAVKAADYMAERVIGAARDDLTGADLDLGANVRVLDYAVQRQAPAERDTPRGEDGRRQPMTVQIVLPERGVVAEWLVDDINALLGQTTTLQMGGFAT